MRLCSLLDGLDRMLGWPRPTLDVSVSLPRQTVVEQAAAPTLSALAFFFVMTSYYIIRPVMGQLSGAVGSQSLPLFYGAVVVVMLLLTPVFGMLVARFRRRQLIGWSYSFFILCLLAFVPAFVAQDRIGARELGVAFFVWASVFNLFVVSLFWSFMADIFSSGEARRVFSLIALGGMAGAIFGPLVTKLLVQVIGVAPLLVVSAAALGVSLILLLRLSAQQQQRPGNQSEQAIGGSLWAGIRELWSRPFLRYMALLMLFGDGIGTLAYALVADYAKAHFTSTVARTSFYNDLDLATNLLGAALQLSVTPWLLVRRGAGWGLVVPSLVNLALLAGVALTGGGNLALFSVSVPLLVVMQVVTRGFAYGMTKPAVDALYTRVPRETRYKGKNFVETAVWRFGDVVVTSAVSGLRMLGWGISGLALLGAGVATLATLVSRRAGWSPDLAPEGRVRLDKGETPPV
jgi:AAA family ATP:ADP antiporter